jgi:CheY-like chemotaxis protein
MNLTHTQFISSRNDLAQSGTILIADDSKINRKILSSICHQFGHKTLEAENGLQVLEILTSEDIDVLLLDIIMPEMTGDKILEIIKANAKLNHLPIIIISSVEEMETIIGCIEKGADDYLTKPFNRTLLQARIRASIERKRHHDLEKLYREQLEEEQQRSESLLRVIFPETIVTELKKTNRFNPRLFENVAVMF